MENTLDEIKERFKESDTKEHNIQELHKYLKEKIKELYELSNLSSNEEGMENVLKKIKEENIYEQVESYITLSMEVKFQEEKLKPNFPENDFRQMYNYDDLFELRQKIEGFFE